MTASALILTGHGLNSEHETAAAFESVGLRARLMHVDDLLRDPKQLDDHQIFVVPGGFSYADDTGGGTALAARLRFGLKDALLRFLQRDTLALGVCNGCQVLIRLGLAGPGPEHLTLLPNRSGTYVDRFVTLAVGETASPWLQGIERMVIPVAHGEGRFHVPDGSAQAVAALQVLTYAAADGSPAEGAEPANPNGSDQDLAGVVDPTGRVLALMPHPERALHFHHHDDWPVQADRLRRSQQPIPEWGQGRAVFENAARYFA